MIIYDTASVSRMSARTGDYLFDPWTPAPIEPRSIRVGSRSRQPGPDGTRRHWHSAPRHVQFYQEHGAQIIDHVIIRVHGDINIHCYSGTEQHFSMLDNSFALVPPDHLRRVVAEKTAGFHLVNTAGIGASASYMGGLNPAHDYRSTRYDDRQAILITYGALWENRELNICPTVFHEIGHVMTHRGNGLDIASVDPQRHGELGGVRVSRNPGRLEALCNAYMYLICYSSGVDAIHHYGSRPVSIQKDQRTRDALRGCPAFQRLDTQWQQRYIER